MRVGISVVQLSGEAPNPCVFKIIFTDYELMCLSVLGYFTISFTFTKAQAGLAEKA